MASRPRATVTIDGQNRKFFEVVFSQPDGDGGGTVSIKLARPSYSVDSTSHVVVKMGGTGGRARLETVFDSSVMESSQYSIEEIGDSLSIRFRSKLNDKKDLAPSVEREYFEPNGGGLHALMRYVAITKIGYTLMITNVPNISMPARIPLEPTESYWSALMRFLDPLRPLILPDEERSTLYIWSLDVAIPGQPYALPLKRSETVTYPKEVRQIVNQALIRWYPSGEDGQHWINWGNGEPQGFDCTGATNQYSDPSGDLLATTTQLCGEPVDLSNDPTATLEEREVGEEAPEQDETGAVRVLRHEVYAVWRNPDTNEIDNEVLVSQVITAFGANGTTRSNPLYKTDIKILYVPGTDYKFSSGHTSHTEGYVDVPGVGLSWYPRLYNEIESIVYGLYRSKPGQLIKLYSTKQCRGSVLMPDKVALWQGANNRIINVSASSDQWTYVGPISWEISSLAPAGTTSMKSSKRIYNYLTKRWSGGPTDDVLGHYPNEDAQKGQPIEELVQDEASIGTYGARTAVTIDATWIGTEVEPTTGGDADRTIGREWAIEMALAMFRRSGKRIATLSATHTKLLTKMHRGAVVRATRRAGANPHDFVVTGLTMTARATGEGAEATYDFSTDLTARRLERGTTDA